MPLLGEPQQDYEIAPSILAAEERRRAQLRTSTSIAVQQSPDQEAEIQSLSGKTGLAPSIIRDNLDTVRAHAQATDPAIRQMPQQSPKTAAFLANPSNAAVAQDDHKSLTLMESLYRVVQSNIAANVAMATARRAGAALAETAPSLLGALETRLKATMAKPEDKYGINRSGPMMMRARQAVAGQLEAAGKYSAGIAGTIRGERSANPFVEYPLQAVESMSQMIVPAVAGILGGPPAAIAAIGLLQAGRSGVEALDMGVEPATALLYSGGMGIVEAGFEIPPVHLLLDQLKIGGKVGRYFLKNIAAEVATEEPTTFFESLLEWSVNPENKDKTLKDYYNEHSFMGDFVETGIVTTLAALGFGGIVGALSYHIHGKSPQEVFLEKEGETVMNSPSAKRSPETMGGFVDSAAEGTGADKRYIAPEKIRERAAQVKMDPGALVDAMTEGGRAKLEEATQAGTDVEISASDYAMKVAQSEHAAYFNKRTHVGDPMFATGEEVDLARDQALQDLTPEEIQQQETIQANLAQLESPEVTEAFKASVAEAAQAPELQAAATPESVVDYWQGVEDRAKQRIRERGTLTGERLGAGVDPADIVDVLKIGTAKVVKGVRNFAQWSSEMISEYGPQIRPYLRNIYAKSVAEAAASLNLSPEAVKEAAASVVIDNAVGQAEDDAATIPLYTTAVEAGMSEEDFAKYEFKMKQASLARRTKLEAEYRKSFARELTDYYQAKKEETQQAVAAELNQSRDQQALAYLQKGAQPNGDALEIPAAKLDQKALEQQYGKHKESPVMQGLRRIDAYRTEGGEHPDLIGERLGYASGDEMARAVIATPKFEDAVKAETERRMAEQYGDLLTDGTLDQKARDAAMLLGRAEMAADEMKALLKAMKDSGKQGLRDIKAIRVQDARAAAERKVSAMPVRSLNPRLHYAAARKASMKALEAFQKGDMEAAWLAKNQEITNVEMYRATRNALDRINDAREESKAYFRTDEQLAKTRDMGFVEGARAIASRLFFPNRAATVDEAMQRIQKHDPQNYAMVELLLPPLPVQDWSQAPYGAVEDMLDAADHLWEMSRRDKQARINMELIDRAEIVEKLNARLRELPQRYRGLGEKGDLTPSERIEGILLGAKAWNRRVESLITELDGGPEGPFRDFFWNTVRDQTTTFRTEKTGYMRKLHDILQPIQDTLTKTKIAAPELDGFIFGRGGTSGKAQLLGAMLHIGNRKQPTSNMVKFLVNRGWGTWDDITGLDTSQWDLFMKRMEEEKVVTKADYDFLQAVWDLFDEMKPLLQKSHMEQYGFTFEEVTADPFTTSFGTYRGGYVPALIDPLANQPMKLKAEKEMVFEDKGHLAFPSAGRGSTISRVVTMDPEYRLAMNLQFLPQHIDWALRFAYIQPAVKDVTKIVTDKTFRSNLNAFDPGAGSDILIPWLSRAATQRISETGKWKPLDKFFTVLRNNVAMQVLTVNVGNAMQNISGAFLAAVKIENRRFLANGSWRYVRAPMETAAYIRRQSAYMQTALDDSGRELQNQIQDILLNPSIYAQAKQFTIKHGQFLSTASQHLLSQVVWLAAREDAEARGIKDPVRHADSVVRETQSSFFAEDISRFETGTPFQKALAMFSNYWIMNANLLFTETVNNLRSDRGAFARAGRFMSVIILGFELPSIVSKAVLNLLSGDWDDDDDDTHIDELLNLVVSANAQTAFSMIPYGGPVLAAAYGSAFTSQAYDDDIRFSPAASMIQSSIKSLGKVIRAEDMEARAEMLTGDKRVARDLLNLLGLLTGTQIGALGKPLGYLMDVSQGKAEPENPLDVGRGLASGRAPRQ